MQEIERKFLVTSSAYREEASSVERIVQGFLNTDPERTVRVRIKGLEGYITVKGLSNAEGTTRFEWEKAIPLKDAETLLLLCEEGVLEKNRHYVSQGAHIFEVDEFLGNNEGLVVAEVELSDEQEQFSKPLWLGKEVTGDIRYYNSQLSKNPFKKWKS